MAEIIKETAGLTLVKSTRATSHLDRKILGITKAPAYMGKHYGFNHTPFYQVRGYEVKDLALYTVYYLDGQMLGPICGVLKIDEYTDTVTLEHQSPKEGHSFVMTFKR